MGTNCKRATRSHGRVAFLPSVPVRLKWLKPKEPQIEPRTLGEHLRRSRLQRNLTQKGAASLLGVDSGTVFNWEKGRTKPPVCAVPRLAQFLGYDPYAQARTIPERMLAKRRAMGWSVRQAALQVGVDPTSWGDWERGKTILFRKHRVLVARLIGLPVEEVDRDMRVRWYQSHQKDA